MVDGAGIVASPGAELRLWQAGGPSGEVRLMVPMVEIGIDGMIN